MTSDPFFLAGNTIVESKRAAQEKGTRLGRWQDVGVFFRLDTPASVRNALVVPIPSEDEWEKTSLELHALLPAETQSPKPKSISTKTIIRK